MATNKNSENNWGGMAPSSKKLTTPKTTLPTTKKSTPAPKAPAKPIIYGRGGAYAAGGGAGALSVGNLINDYFSGVKERIAGGAADTGRIPTPAATGTMASNYGAGAGGSVIGKGTTVKPSDIARIIKPVGGTGASKSKYMTPEQLYVDPTPAYQPVLDYLKQQEQSARDRYAVNNANIKNIFGALTGLTAADSARITKQFTDSLAASKADLAARTAEARAGAAAGTAQAAATGAERGGGDAMAVNPIQVAAEEGIARSNEYATTWQALQNANQQQAMADISARGAGYGQQEVGAIQQLAQNLEDKLLAIGGNTAQVQSDIAQAKFGQQKDIQQVKFQLSEQAKAQAQAAAAAKPSYGKDLFGLQKLMSDNGQDFNSMMSGVDAAYTAAWNAKNPTVGGVPQSKTVNAPKAADVKAAWIAAGGDSALLPYVDKYVSTVYG